MRRLVEELLVAFQFLTRLPVPRIGFQPDSLSRSAKLFPVVGLVIGLGASLLQHILTPHLNHTLVALLVHSLSYFLCWLDSYFYRFSLWIVSQPLSFPHMFYAVGQPCP